jgi:hypothetical protein
MLGKDFRRHKDIKPVGRLWFQQSFYQRDAYHCIELDLRYPLLDELKEKIQPRKFEYYDVG